MNRSILLCSALALVVVTARVSSRATGIYTSTITRSTPSCGACHRPTPGAAPGLPVLHVSTTPSKFVLAASEAITVTTTATGGQTASMLGGFATDATRGTFAAGTGSRVQSSGRAITHSMPGNRLWTYGYTAPSQPGLVEMFSVVNTVDGNGRNNSGDMWGFHGFDSTSTTSTPIRLYVNAANVSSIGAGCVGSFGNTPVLGAKTAPTVGNGSFGFELHGAAPNTGATFLLGSNAGFMVDLGLVGVTGCTLYVDSVVQLPLATGAGNPQRGEGSATIAVPIANDPSLSGATLQVQVAILDPQNGRPLPVTMTNGLAFTIQ